MPNKYQLVNEIANEALKEITESSENWIKFLNTASNNYKYSFNEQVLIYAQKPNATACADIETWNKRLKRWVNKGAKGIALISIENGRNVLRHVFDISDTHSGINQELKLWTVTLLGGLFVTVLSFILILTVYGRFFKLYMYTAIAPIPLSSFAGEPTQNIGKSFLKSYIAVCLEGAIIVLACVIFSAFVTNSPSVDTGAATVTMVWKYVGELIFNMLVLVGTIRLSDRIIREMMGI